jgi:hypothetical protein
MAMNARDTLFHDFGRPVTDFFSHLRRTLDATVQRASIRKSSSAKEARSQSFTETAVEDF